MLIMRPLNAIFVVIFLSHITSVHSGLYSEADDVLILDNSTFDSTVIGSRSSWIVKFYSSWCGHCVRFSSLWKNLATECRGWRNLLKIAAVDCVDQTNSNICSHYEIQGFPTILFLPAASSSRPPGVEVHQSDSVDKFKIQLMEYIGNRSLSNLNSQQLLPLQPLRSWNDVWRQTHTQDHAVIIFEPMTSYLGRNVILDLHERANATIVRRIISDVRNPTSYLATKHDGRLTLLVSSQSITKHMTALAALREGALNGTTYRQHIPGDSPATNNASLKMDGGRDDDPKAAWRSDSYLTLHEADLVSTLFYSLRHEIPLRGRLDRPHVDLLENHLQMLIKYLPIRTELLSGLEILLAELLTRTSRKNLGGMGSEEWLSLVSSVFDENDYQDESNWVSCKGSAPSLRGYPCGLWMTFHALTVNAALQSSDAECVRTLLSIRSYVENYFGCKECVANFMKGAIKMESRARDCREAVLFLWKSHNKANARLKGDRTEDPKHPKTLFPNELQCPSCRPPLRASTLRDGWNEDEVFAFLVRMYGRSGVAFRSRSSATDGDSAELDVEGRTGSRLETNQTWPSFLNKTKMRRKGLFGEERIGLFETLRSTTAAAAVEVDVRNKLVMTKENILNVINIFNRFDVGVCMAFYLLCIFFIVLLYLHVMKKRKLCCLFRKAKRPL